MSARPLVALVMALTSSAAFAGCTTDGAGARASDPASLTSGSGFGTMEGIVTDDESRPLADARVTVEGLQVSARTDPDGSYRLEDVPAGLRIVRATAPRHEAAVSDAAIAPDAVTVVDFALPLLPSDRPYSTTEVYEGHYDCAHETPIWTGDCMILYKALTGQNESYTSERFAYRSTVQDAWATVVLELEWTYASNNQLDGMRLYLEEANGTEDGHAFKIARTDGPEPRLQIVLQRGETHPRADVYPGTDVRVRLEEGGEDVLLRVFPRGHFYSATSQVCTNQAQQTGCLLGVGLGLDIRFKVYFSVFYREPAPQGFTAIPT